VVLAGFAVYLDAVVQEKFSGKRWTIPAKVYARPLELFVPARS
jgi:penicillin-binding protein 1B